MLPLLITEYYMLAKDEWKYDAVPEIMDGKNILDFIDPDILAVSHHAIDFDSLNMHT